MTTINYDPINGIMLINPEITDPLYFSKVVEVVCFDDMTANSCVVFVNENANKVNSRYNHNIANLDIPIINGIAIRDGIRGEATIFANTPGCLYTSDRFIPGNYNDVLFVGQDGLLTNVVPTLAAGDLWAIEVGTKIEDYKFVYSPVTPVDIINNPYPSPTPPIIGSNELITLSESMAKLTCFRINNVGKAFKVTTNDATIPIVDGITLAAGGIDQQVSVARLKNYYYETGNYFATSNIYWLDHLGAITTTRSSIDSYQVIIGRSIPNSTKFIFDPQMPIKIN